jgi:hypothetical protein
MFRSRALIKVFFNYWRQNSRPRHGAVMKHVATSPYVYIYIYIYIYIFCFCQILWIMQKFALSAVRLTTAGLSLLKFAPSLPLEFSLCVVHQLNYTAS